ncbi:hypothetical protein [Streptomyces sp. B1I3]|uniref:hypothetical protein n=1 Tax=Streptomyces sp. B1I3 TaxID=3042264 RepID=UPI00277FC8BB|nr:hypothetical protein [Streptomyces sp. B1I3]MDQ0791615.1 hypothetical protein [Streptomyces sp. B1I3]
MTGVLTRAGGRAALLPGPVADPALLTGCTSSGPGDQAARQTSPAAVSQAASAVDTLAAPLNLLA